MLMNTLHAHGVNPGTADRIIRVNFDFSAPADPTLDKTRIRRVNRQTGFWEEAPLVADGDQYHVDVTLSARTGDLFKYVLFTPMVADLDFDADLDANDIDLIRAAANDAKAHPRHDINYDGAVDDSDLTYQVETAMGTGLGDGDLNFIVNFADFVLVSNNFGLSATGWMQGNYNSDDVINVADFVAMSNNFNMVYAADETDVPEPAGVALAWVGALMVAMRRARNVMSGKIIDEKLILLSIIFRFSQLTVYPPPPCFNLMGGAVAPDLVFRFESIRVMHYCPGRRAARRHTPRHCHRWNSNLH